MIGQTLKGYNGQIHFEETGVRLTRKGFAALGLQSWGAEKVIPYSSIVGVEFRSALLGGARLGYLQLSLRGGPELKNDSLTSREALLTDENSIAWQRAKRNAEFEAARDFILTRINPAVTPTKTCPDCAEPIRAEALVCRFCGYRFD